jgi:hypothetical protein
MNRRLALGKLAVLGSGAWVLASRQPVRAEDEADDEIPLDKVPEKVRKAADAAVPKATWETAYRSEEDKVVTFELEGKNSQGREITVTLTPDGKVEELETEIPLKDVPQAVKDTLKAKWPRFKPSLAFEMQEEGKVVGYDFEGKRPKDKEEIVIFVSADGKQAEIEKDD